MESEEAGASQGLPGHEVLPRRVMGPGEVSIPQDINFLLPQMVVNNSTLINSQLISLLTLLKLEEGACIEHLHMSLQPPPSAPMTSINTLIAPTQDHVLRLGLLTEMHDMLRQQQISIKQLAIVGVSGSGKTVLAHAFARELLQQSISHNSTSSSSSQASSSLVLAYVIDASFEKYQKSFEGLADILGIDIKKLRKLVDPDKDVLLYEQKLAEKIHLALNQYSYWILIFDNVHELKNINCFIPSMTGQNGVVLYTSQNTRLLEKPSRVDITKGLDEEDAELLLEKLTYIHDKEAAIALANYLDRLPLAIQVAGRYIRHQREDMQNELYHFASYQAEHQEALQLLDAEQIEVCQQQGVFVTQYVAIKLSAEKLKLPGYQLLTFCSLFDYKMLPEELLCDYSRQYQGHSGGIQSNIALKELEQYGLLNRAGNRWSLHQITHSYAWLTYYQLLQTTPVVRINYIEEALDLLSEDKYRGDLVQQLEAQKCIYPHAKALLRKIHPALIRRLPSSIQIKIAGMFHSLAISAWRLGESREARTLFLEALTLHEELDGIEPVQTGRVLVNLSLAYSDLRQTVLQKDVLERALHIFESCNDEQRIAVALTNLGTMYLDLGLPVQAIDVLEKALAIKRRHFGAGVDRKVEIGITLMNLGNAYCDLGEMTQALGALEESLAIKREHYQAENHVEIAITLTNLGNALEIVGRVQEAKSYLEQALQIEEAHYGKKHHRVAITLAYLGRVYLGLGNLEQAKVLLTEALQIQIEYYGPTHPEVAAVLILLSRTCDSLADRPFVEEALTRALSIYESHYHIEHQFVALPALQLGRFYLDVDDASKASEYLTRARAIQEKNGDIHRHVLAETLIYLGKLTLKQGKPSKALLLCQEAHAIASQHYQDFRPVLLGQIHLKLATIFHTLPDDEQAQAEGKLALTIFEELTFPLGHPWVQAAQFKVDLSSSAIMFNQQSLIKGNLSRFTSLSQVIGCYVHIKEGIVKAFDMKSLRMLYLEQEALTEAQVLLLYELGQYYVADAQNPLSYGLDSMLATSVEQESLPSLIVDVFKLARRWHPCVAAVEGRVTIMRYLISYRRELQKNDLTFDIHSCDAVGNTYLHLAVMNRHDHMIGLLIERGVDIYAKNQLGQTAFGLDALTDDERAGLPRLPFDKPLLKINCATLFFHGEAMINIKSKYHIAIFFVKGSDDSLKWIKHQLKIRVQFQQVLPPMAKRNHLASITQEFSQLLASDVSVKDYDAKQANHLVSLDVVLERGKEQVNYLNDVRTIIYSHGLTVLASTAIQDGLNMTYIEALTPEQQEGLVKLGYRYEEIHGKVTGMAYNKDIVYALLSREEQQVVDYAKYWSWHILVSCCGDPSWQSLIADAIDTAIANGIIANTVNMLDAYGHTPLDRALGLPTSFTYKDEDKLFPRHYLALRLLKVGGRAKAIDGATQEIEFFDEPVGQSSSDEDCSTYASAALQAPISVSGPLIQHQLRGGVGSSQPYARVSPIMTPNMLGKKAKASNSHLEQTVSTVSIPHATGSITINNFFKGKETSLVPEYMPLSGPTIILNPHTQISHQHAGVVPRQYSQPFFSANVKETLMPHPTIPTPYEYALISQGAYFNDEAAFRAGEEVHWQYLHDRGWRLEVPIEHQDYHGSIWVNDDKKQVVIAHRGSHNITSWVTDIESVMQHKPGSFVYSAIETLRHPRVHELVAEGYRLSTTGHSLGGFLAQVCVYWSKRRDFAAAMPTPPMTSISSVSGTISTSSSTSSSSSSTSSSSSAAPTVAPSLDVSAVVFDAPGVVDFLESLDVNLRSGRGNIDLGKLNIHNFCAGLTVVSTYGTQTGTIWHLGDIDEVGLPFVMAHKMEHIISGFNPDTGLPGRFRQMVDWPQADYSAYSSGLADAISEAKSEMASMAFTFINGIYKRIRGGDQETWLGQIFLKKKNQVWEAYMHPVSTSGQPALPPHEEMIKLAIDGHYSALDEEKSKQRIALHHFDVDVQAFLQDIVTARSWHMNNIGWDEALRNRYGAFSALLQVLNIKLYNNRAELILPDNYENTAFDFQQELLRALSERGPLMLADFVAEKIITLLQNVDKLQIALAALEEGDIVAETLQQKLLLLQNQLTQAQEAQSKLLAVESVPTTERLPALFSVVGEKATVENSYINSEFIALDIGPNPTAEELAFAWDVWISIPVDRRRMEVIGAGAVIKNSEIHSKSSLVSLGRPNSSDSGTAPAPSRSGLYGPRGRVPAISSSSSAPQPNAPADTTQQSSRSSSSSSSR